MLSIVAVLPLAASLAQALSPDTQIPLTDTRIDHFPLLGFGTWNIRDNATAAVSAAIKTGYKHIDCAAAYRNEESVGKGIAKGLKETDQSREDIWVTSKLWNDHHDPSAVEAGIDQTLSDLGLDYLDLYLMHWPVAQDSKGKNKISFVSTWKAMVQLVQKGKTRHIGISNFDPEQLEHLLNNTDHKPFAHQMEMHPYLQQNEWLDYHKKLGIQVTAYSPLAGTNPTYGSGKHQPTPLLENEEISHIAESNDCTAAQLALAWGMDRGANVIPKSVHADRIEENFASTECGFDKYDFEGVTKVGQKNTFRYNNPSKSWGVPLYEGLEGV